jgi:hypothetical protein
MLADMLRSLAGLRLTDDDGLLTPAGAAASDDPVLASFAASLPPEAWIADLRQARFGDGFAWGRFGPRTEIRRASRERLWALAAPERRPGPLRRLFGRSAG